MNCKTNYSKSSLYLATLFVAVLMVDSHASAAGGWNFRIPSFRIPVESAASAPCVRNSTGTKSHNFSFGNSTVSVNGGFEAEASVASSGCSSPGASAEVGGDVNLDVFGIRRSLLDAKAEVSNDPDGSNISLHVEIGSNTLIDIDQEISNKSWSRSRNITLLSANRTFFVGGFPVNVSVSVGAGMSADLELKASYPVEISGELGAWATGSAGAYLSIGIARAGVSATLRLLDTELRSSMSLRSDGRVSGSVTLSVEAVRIKIRLVVDVRNWRWRWTEVGGITIVNYSRGSYSRNLLSL
tara:strand:+ start:1112 stop:2005 length:894 start_codon:yes stop_codon:yes gene_type:complete